MSSPPSARQALTAQQKKVLRWIDEGSPAGVFEGFGHRQTARALENRSLIRIWGSGKTWRAEVTTQGCAALAVNETPPDDTVVESPPVDALLRRLVEAGTPLDVGSEFGRDQLQQMVHDALRSAARPPGRRLAYEALGGWNSSDFQVRLVPSFEDHVAQDPVPVPEHVGRLHPLARRFRDSKEAGVSKEHLTRAVRLLHALATEAERRGIVATHPSAHSESFGGQSKPLSGDVALARGDDVLALELRELPPNKGAARPNIWDGDWRAGSGSVGWFPTRRSPRRACCNSA